MSEKNAKKIRRMTPEKRAEFIVNKAKAFISTHGADKLTFEGLSRSCGVSKTLIYHYFRNRKHLLSIILEEKLSVASKVLRIKGGYEDIESPEPSDALKAMNEYVDNYFTYCRFLASEIESLLSVEGIDEFLLSPPDIELSKAFRFLCEMLSKVGLPLSISDIIVCGIESQLIYISEREKRKDETATHITNLEYYISTVKRISENAVLSFISEDSFSPAP